MFGCIQYWGRYLESWDPETLWIRRTASSAASTPFSTLGTALQKMRSDGGKYNPKVQNCVPWGSRWISTLFRLTGDPRRQQELVTRRDSSGDRTVPTGISVNFHQFPVARQRHDPWDKIMGTSKRGTLRIVCCTQRVSHVWSSTPSAGRSPPKYTRSQPPEGAQDHLWDILSVYHISSESCICGVKMR